MNTMIFEHKKIQTLEDYFLNLSARKERGIYFCRIDSYSEAVRKFLFQYYNAARVSGVVMEGRIPNPDEKNLSYYSEMMGMDFQMSMGFLMSSLNKWLPRMNTVQRERIAASIYDVLDALRHEGKNENMLRNSFIKFMCWLYYKFERVLNRLGDENIPKLLYEGDISNYELKILAVLANAGCDVVLLQYHGDEHYRKLDPDSKISFLYRGAETKKFPEEFSLQWIREQMEHETKIQRLYGTLPSVKNCTSAWMEGSIFGDIQKGASVRGTDKAFFYNCFCRITGVEDKLTYVNELYQFQLQLKNQKRNLVIEHELMRPTMDEIAKIKHQTYRTTDQMLLDLSRNINGVQNIELKRLMMKGFIDILLEETDSGNTNLNKLTNIAVYVLCWLKRYQEKLFHNWNMPDVACFIYMNGCKSRAEVLFLKLLARLPVDVLILVPNLNSPCILEDTWLFEKKYAASMEDVRFPTENVAAIQMGTAAYHAERELDTIMYQDSGMYRNFQYRKAVSISLVTMYEEIAILWDQELKYRPNFSVVNDTVNMPVIFARISGVKDGAVPQYWQGIKALLTPETVLIKELPYINSLAANPIKAHAAEFYKNGKLHKEKIKSHPCYRYGYIREEMQDYILEKLQQLIDQKTIKGTGENGTEYTIVSVLLNINKELMRKIQNFDFTKRNAKLIFIHTTEKVLTLEDSILTAFFNLIGFDILFFIPTGYQNIEKYFNRKIMEEQQIGDYLYDLSIPDLDRLSLKVPTFHSLRDKLFKRGN